MEKEEREMVRWEGEWRSEMNGGEVLESVAFEGRGLREVGIFAEVKRERERGERRRVLYFSRPRQNGTSGNSQGSDK